MIIRDENGNAVSAQSISDITLEIRFIEKRITEAVQNKKNGGSLSDEERAELNRNIQGLQTVISAIDDETKRKASAMELISFIKELTKFKKFVEDLKKLAEND